jgi:hypothetical protein
MGQCFFESGKGWKDFAVAKSLASHLMPPDIIINLNYDTVFELSIRQLGIQFHYSPKPPSQDSILVAKPHGSLNMVMNNNSFTFGRPDWLGSPEASGYRSYSGIIPPRLNKSYIQHPAAKMILAPVYNTNPKRVIMWGVGLTESDADLLEVYQHWAKSAQSFDIINPSAHVAEKASSLFPCEVRHFPSVTEWEKSLASQNY